MDQLAAKGFFEDTPEMRVSNSQRSELGVIKRANLEMSRQRTDILYSLPREKLEALSKEDLPYQDRKVWLVVGRTSMLQPASSGIELVFLHFYILPKLVGLATSCVHACMMRGSTIRSRRLLRICKIGRGSMRLVVCT